MGETNGTERQGSIVVLNSLDLAAVLLSERLLTKLLSRLVENAVALRKQNLRSTLEEQTVGVVVDLDRGTHALALRIEWEQLDDWEVTALNAESTKTKAEFSPIKQGSFGLGSDKSSLAIF